MSVSVETVVLATLLSDSQTLADNLPNLRQEYFSTPENISTFSAVERLFSRGQSVNKASIRDLVPNIVDVGKYFKPENVDHDSFRTYCSILRNRYVKRSLTDAYDRWGKTLDKKGVDLDRLMSQNEDLLVELSMTDSTRSSPQMATAIKKAMATAKANISAHREGTIIGIDVCNDDVNRMTGGLRRKEFTVIAGRPGMGKSLLMLAIAKKAVLAYGKVVLVVSIEMSAEECSMRMLADELDIRYDALRNGWLTKEEFSKLNRGVVCSECSGTEILQAVEFENGNCVNTCSHCGSENVKLASEILEETLVDKFLIDDRASMTEAQIISSAKAHKIRYPHLEAVFLDHLQHVKYIGQGY